MAADRESGSYGAPVGPSEDPSEHPNRHAIVAELGTLALASGDTERFLADATTALATALGTDLATVIELRPADSALVLRGGYGVHAENVGAVIPNESQTGFAIRTLAPLVVADARLDRRFSSSPLMRRYELVSGISCPIVVDDEPLGVVSVHTRTGRLFDEGEVSFVRAVATLIGWTIRREREERERRLAEAALRSSEQRFRMLAEHSVDVIFRLQLRPELRYEYVSPAVARVIGCTPEQFYADPGIVSRHIHPDDRELLRDWLEKPGSIVVRWVRDDGTIVYGERRARVVRDAQGQAVAVEGAVRDVTERALAERERAALEAQLRQSQKLEAIGRLAGGVAHDFNNLLMAIIAYAEQLIDGGRLDTDDLVAAYEIRAAARRGGALTRQLLAFGRRQTLAQERLDLSAEVCELEGMLRRVIGEDVALEVRAPAGLPEVHADRDSISQILLNLAVNARDAMPDGGRLRLATSVVELREHNGDARLGLAPGRYVRLEVSDDGIGMDEATREHIFEPFFTTKDAGTGSGLGLSTVYGIVQQSEGAIRVRSQAGAGTSFEILLPALEPALRSAVPVAAPEPAREAPPGRRVLLVEDEEIVRRLVCEQLETAGYRVAAAADADQAFALFAAEGADVVITDVVMPGIKGPELVRRLRAGKPGLPALFISGYAGDAFATEGGVGDAVFLQKPFTNQDLRAKLGELLDG